MCLYWGSVLTLGREQELCRVCTLLLADEVFSRHSAAGSLLSCLDGDEVSLCLLVIRDTTNPAFSKPTISRSYLQLHPSKPSESHGRKIIITMWKQYLITSVQSDRDRQLLRCNIPLWRLLWVIANKCWGGNNQNPPAEQKIILQKNCQKTLFNQWQKQIPGHLWPRSRSTATPNFSQNI